MPLTAAGATVIGAGISAASAAGAAGAAAANNKRSYKWTSQLYDKQNKFNAEQAQIAYDRQREFYDYSFNKEFENEKYWADYNTPLRQMQRMKEAGLNPALMTSSFDSGNVNASASGSAQSQQASAAGVGQFSTSPTFTSQSLGDMFGLLNVMSQLEVNKSVAEKNKVDAAKTAGVDTENVIADTDLKKSEKAKQEADTDLSAANTAKVKQETENLKFELDKILPKTYEKMKSEISKNMQDVLSSQQLTKGQVALMAQQITELLASARLKNKQRELLDKQVKSFNVELMSRLGVNRQQMESLKSAAALNNINTQQITLQNKLTEDLFNSMYDSMFETSKSKFRPDKDVPNFGDLQMRMLQFQFLRQMMNMSKQ